MTDPQRRALTLLSSKPFASPAELGAVISDRPHLTAQGAGRIGGSMAARLIKLGWAVSCSWERGGFPAYRITRDGQEALSA